MASNEGKMRRRWKGAAVILAVCSICGFGLWQYSLTPFYSLSIEERNPIIFIGGIFDELQGGTVFPRRMVVVEKKSFWPYATKYNVYWSGITLINDESGMEIENNWVNVSIWNGYGIDKIKISGIESKKLYFPTKKSKDASVSAEGIKVRVGQNTEYHFKRKWSVIPIDPPLKKDKNLQIIVWDKYGNVTEASIPVSSIVNLK